ncbi:hypothetical protein [Streptomyces sasae]|uniref:hypothetical protein n=1 Tax=Streptomyces sasae TaxID=1266772 RepID=UPI002931F4EB|nr:hypothetical protein [Streptomyces sasae]
MQWTTSSQVRSKERPERLARARPAGSTYRSPAHQPSFVQHFDLEAAHNTAPSPRATRSLTVTLERLRVDCQLEEAPTHGADPLHLALVFGIREKTAIRYADSARCGTD